ncbi:MAG: PAS domain-containing protein [Candidatus Thiodiazotropha sp. (ex Gloverina cf. vestifex)]|nr:PAS domain-containing protein [Candidatus Thiodiazotropha sp. (ex Gloverina cf. vestifex)]
MRARLDTLQERIDAEDQRLDVKDSLHWRSLRLFLLYRITLTLFIVYFFYSGTGPGFLGQTDPELFAFIITLYTGLTILSALFWYWRSPQPEHQAYLILFVDIAAITLLMHASGGVQSGMGMLIAVSITGGALIMGGRAALLFAALAALAVITEQLYSHFNGMTVVRFSQAGFLGTVFFATALLTLVLSGRARASEALAQARADELGHMAMINEYVVQHMRTGVLVLDSDDSILMINNPAWHLLGMPTAAVGSDLLAASPELSQRIKHWRKDITYDPTPFQSQSQGPELKAHFKPLGSRDAGDVLVFLEDTSQITREALQMKLASLGRLTASIAHEIRNPLGAISHASQLFDESPDLNPADKRLTEIIKTNSARVNQVIENVLQLSRRSPGNPKPILLKPWFEDLTSEMKKNHGFTSKNLHMQIEPANCQIIADTEQLRQIISNLCNNAKEAMDDLDSLQLQIAGGLTQEYNHPVVDIIDNGPGIKPEVAKQIFEPFFTTRNQGTGLGLYIAKELCEINRIRLEYIPGPTGGSCFRLHFNHWRTEDKV